LNETQFNLIAQQFAFSNFFAMGLPLFSAPYNSDLWFQSGGAGHFFPVVLATDGAVSEAHMNDFLVKKFAEYWSRRDMYERTYSGTGLGGSFPLEILDKVTINGNDYTVIEITRDLLKNEMTIKAVLY
jgi:hypothetical protein